MNKWLLPSSVHVAGLDFDIDTSYITVLDVLSACNRDDYDKEEKLLYMLMSMVKDFDKLPVEHYAECSQRLVEFIDMGEHEENKGKKKPAVMDWEQDAQLIIPEINKQLGNGLDVRTMPKMHWWTFLGYYQSIGESAYTHIIALRTKKAMGKKMEKWEQEYINENPQLFNLKKHLTDKEKADKQALDELLG